MPAAHNDAELNLMLVAVFSSVIDELSQELLEKLKETINAVVYDPFSPSENGYKRLGENGGLLGSWDKSNTVVSGNQIQNEISEFPERMILDAPGFVHGSLYYEPNDVREFLSNLIIEGKSGPLFGEGFWRSSRDFWGEFIQLIEGGEADLIIQKIMTRHGLKWKKI